MRTLPSGTVTLLFTDIEGSTRLLHELGQQRFDQLLGAHRQILREAFAAQAGAELRTEGDSFFAAFERAGQAVAAAEAAQAELAQAGIPVRIGIHTGEPLRVEHEDGYVGIDVHRGARIAGAAHGGQVLLSQATRELLGAGTPVVDLGFHRLKDLARPERLYQLGKTEFPPLHGTSPRNIPVPATPLVGRERELAELEELLGRDDVRLVTVTGPPGTGKTRLVLAHALLRQRDFSDGVFFVDLAPLTEAALVPDTIVQALGVKDPTAGTASERLVEHVAGKHLLLVVDNFEHVLDAVPVLNDLLAAAPDSKILATSRARLRLAAERDFPLAPLVEDEAVELFVDRAVAAEPRFGLNGNRQLVSEICRKLEGLPLALELAAARVKLLSLDSLLTRLDQSLPLLTSGVRDVPERQRTMRATIEWSYELLEPEEQQLLARLSVFSGGCSLAAAEEVCGADLDTLGSLVDKSLLRHGEERFRMLDTIREYALERLETSPDGADMHRRHADHFLKLAEEAQPELAQRRVQAEWLERLGREHENFRGALTWALEADPEERGMRLGASLASYFNLRKSIEGRQWLAMILERGGESRPGDRAAVLAGAGQLAQAHGDYDEALRLLQESFALRQKLGDEQGISRSLADLGWLALHRGDYRRARADLEQSLALRRRNDEEPAVIGATLNRLGIVALYEGDFDAADELWRDCLAIARERDDQIGQAAALSNLSLNSVYRGDFDLAVAQAEEALALDRMIAYPEAVVDGLDNLARAGLGLEDYGQAHDLWVEGLALAHQVDYKWGVAEFLEGLAGLAAALGENERAASLDGAASALRESVGATLPSVDRPEHERREALVRQRLGDEAWAAARSRGSELTVDRAVALALEEPARSREPV
jgi:predicted ATPase